MPFEESACGVAGIGAGGAKTGGNGTGDGTVPGDSGAVRSSRVSLSSISGVIFR